jgi:hypothetical protein
MTDFYPLVRRAVAELEHNTFEERHAVYERARNALGRILRGSDPLPSASEIVRQCLALDKAIERVETPYSFVETLSHLPPGARTALRNTLEAMRRIDCPSPRRGKLPNRG